MYRVVGWRSWGGVNMIKMHCIKFSKNKTIFKSIFFKVLVVRLDWISKHYWNLVDRGKGTVLTTYTARTVSQRQ